MKTQLKLLKKLLLCYLMLTGSLVNAETFNYSFGIGPQKSTNKLTLLWTPIVKKISAETGFKVNFKTAPDISIFEKRLAAGEYDFAYMNPYRYTFFSQTNGYQVLAKARNKLIRVVLVVRKDSVIKQIVNLDGNILVFPLPAAFAASVFSQSKLKVSGIKFKPKYASSHDWVYRAAAKVLYPTGDDLIHTFNNVAPEICDQLRVLLNSRVYNLHLFSVHLWVRNKALVRSRLL
jgi:phosphonate transport system substrate-binding protein